MIANTRFTGCGGSLKLGVWWFRVRGYGLMVKAWWSHKLPSERFGLIRYFPSRGLRVRVLRPT